MESLRRRDFIKGMCFLGVAAGVKPAAASYDPAAKFDLKISEVEFGIDPLHVEIESHRYNVQVPRPLSVSEQGTLDSVGAI